MPTLLVTVPGTLPVRVSDRQWVAPRAHPDPITARSRIAAPGLTAGGPAGQPPFSELAIPWPTGCAAPWRG